MSHTSQEIASQPVAWQRALDDLPAHTVALPRRGERVAVIGCGTSLFVAQAYAALREESGQGVTDVFPASEARLGRGYDRVLALTRSGTTTEVITALAAGTADAVVTVVTGVAGSPATVTADHVIVLDHADEKSVVQTRFPTTLLVLLRAHLGLPVQAALADVRTALELPLPDELTGAEQITFLGLGWAVGLANEAALKVRETAGHWTESYSAMEYRHGPIAVARKGRAVWSLTPVDPSLAAQIRETGAALREPSLDPLAELVLAQRVAVRRAEAADRDPDNPVNLTRSVILSPAG
ncbi:SIS domain-containing protein [Streptomyces sp. NPDC058417]|uniref:SIS domain-containing protein n=1 Tax=unclassified Streptomyces TaxID=2593676 RepID=UPI00365D504B